MGGEPRAQNALILNAIRRRNRAGIATKEDVDKLLEHIDALEIWLNYRDEEAPVGWEGWRFCLGLVG